VTKVKGFHLNEGKEQEPQTRPASTSLLKHLDSSPPRTRTHTPACLLCGLISRPANPSNYTHLLRPLMIAKSPAASTQTLASAFDNSKTHEHIWTGAWNHHSTTFSICDLRLYFPHRFGIYKPQYDHQGPEGAPRYASALCLFNQIPGRHPLKTSERELSDTYTLESIGGGTLTSAQRC